MTTRIRPHAHHHAHHHAHPHEGDTVKNLELPLLSFSVQAANKDQIKPTINPQGFTRQARQMSVAAWASQPDGCMSARRLAELAPGSGWIADRAMGLKDGGYDIGRYAGEETRRCEPVWPLPLTSSGARFAALAELSVVKAVGLVPAVFVGSPPHRSKDNDDNPLEATMWVFSEAANVATLAQAGILTIFDTGGVVGNDTDAFRVFDLLNRNFVPFYLEPTRPYGVEASSTIRTSIGLVSITAVMEAMEADIKRGQRHWFDDAFMETNDAHLVEWCTGYAIDYLMLRAEKRLKAGRRVIMPLRLLDEAKVRQLVAWRDEGVCHMHVPQLVPGRVIFVKPGEIKVLDRPGASAGSGPVQVVDAPVVIEKPTVVRRP